ncbi:fluoride efflux transporter FluC [Falsiroseomonas sp. HW251]|uniref:fluoride efflux transporter FluC n=1 Tax=Falsiroseomonas sp. HW251 TaxID=3390998 RepID=UPI003D316A79
MIPVTLTGVALVALGGAAGSVCRYLVSLASIGMLGAGFPWGTIAVNVLGSAAIGVAASLELEGPLRLLVIPGFLGGFTTFSAFSLETGALFERSPAVAVAYVVGSVALGVAAFAASYALMRR